MLKNNIIANKNCCEELSKALKSLKEEHEYYEKKYYRILEHKNNQYKELENIYLNNVEVIKNLTITNEIYKSHNLNNLSYDFLIELESNVNEKIEEIGKLKYQIVQEQKQFKSKIKCIACYTNTSNIMFYPCKHICVCQTCHDKISNCPLCRQSITKKTVVYFKERLLKTK